MLLLDLLLLLCELHHGRKGLPIHVGQSVELVLPRVQEGPELPLQPHYPFEVVLEETQHLLLQHVHLKH